MGTIVPTDPLSRPAVRRPGARQRCADADPALARMLAKIVPGAYGCWIPRNRPQRDGYVMMRTMGGGPKRMAHVLFWEALIGNVPPGMELDHLCRVRRCVNPEHLEQVTRSQNVKRSLNGVRQTVCRKGHQISEADLYLDNRGKPRCKRCYFADNKRRQKAPAVCPSCERKLTRGSLLRHVRENCPGVQAA